MQDGLGIARKENYDNIESNIISNIGAVLIKQGRYDSLTYYCTLGLRLAEKLGDSLAMVNNIYGLALYSFYQRFYKSGELAKTGFRMAQQRNYVEPSQLFADILSELSLVKGDLRNYDYYNRLSIELSEQFFNDRMQRNVQLLDKNMIQKKKTIGYTAGYHLKKNTLNYILIGSAVTLLIVSILSYRNYKQKQKLQEQKLSSWGKKIITCHSINSKGPGRRTEQVGPRFTRWPRRFAERR